MQSQKFHVRRRNASSSYTWGIYNFVCSWCLILVYYYVQKSRNSASAILDLDGHMGESGSRWQLVGDMVGAAVGETEGDIVGLAEGSAVVGETVGLTEGEGVRHKPHLVGQASLNYTLYCPIKT